MNLQQELLYLDKNYKIISAEHEFIVHPAVFDILPLTSDSLESSFECSLKVIGYCLQIKSLTIFKETTEGFGDDMQLPFGVPYVFQDKPISYSGTILIGDSPIPEYSIKIGKENCYFYKRVLELVFEEGNLITTIDHSKAMSRIRKNIELGFRSLTNNWDVRCISHFINSTFLGDYRPFSSVKKRLKYLKALKHANNAITGTSKIVRNEK